MRTGGKNDIDFKIPSAIVPCSVMINYLAADWCFQEAFLPPNNKNMKLITVLSRQSEFIALILGCSAAAILYPLVLPSSAKLKALLGLHLTLPVVKVSFCKYRQS